MKFVNRDIYRKEILQYVDLYRKNELIEHVNNYIETIKNLPYMKIYKNEKLDEYDVANTAKKNYEVFGDDLSAMFLLSYSGGWCDAYAFMWPDRYFYTVGDMFMDEITDVCNVYIKDWIKNNHNWLYEKHKDELDDVDYDLDDYLFLHHVVIDDSYNIFIELCPEYKNKLFGEVDDKKYEFLNDIEIIEENEDIY